SWRDFDPTPASWVAVESSRISWAQRVSDLWARVTFELSKFRWGQSHVRQYVLDRHSDPGPAALPDPVSNQTPAPLPQPGPPRPTERLARIGFRVLRIGAPTERARPGPQPERAAPGMAGASCQR